MSKQSSEIPVQSKNFDSSTSLLTSKFPQIADFETQTGLCENLSQNHHSLKSNTWQFGGVRGSCSFLGGSDCSSSPSPLRAVTLPLIYPVDSISKIVLNFRDRARDLLRSGISLPSVMGSGLTDVELLFRTRQPDEEWNVPGWACEVGLPELPTRQHLYKLLLMANGFCLDDVGSSQC